MANEAIASLTARTENWSRFLVKAGQLYKFSFLDQVLIYAQRPDATACAKFSTWSTDMDRKIKPGTNGIVLISRIDGEASVRNVFDVSDTERRRETSLDPDPFVYRKEHESTVAAHLERCFDVPSGNGLAEQLIRLAVRFSEERWQDFKHDIMYSVHGSFLDGLDEDNVSLRFHGAMTASLAFLLLSRCGSGLEDFFEPDDFAGIPEFNGKDLILTLGNAINESAGVILQQIEHAIRTYEHDRTAA